MKGSEFNFKICFASSNWDIKLKYLKSKKDTKFNKEAILELRDRALLMQHTNGYKDRERNDIPSEDEERRSLEEQKTIRDFI